MTLPRDVGLFRRPNPHCKIYRAVTYNILNCLRELNTSLTVFPTKQAQVSFVRFACPIVGLARVTNLNSAPLKLRLSWKFIKAVFRAS